MSKPDAIVEVIVEDERWTEANLQSDATKAVTVTLAHLGLPPDVFEVSVLGCDDTRIAALNDTFRDKAKATNVLSWPSEERAAEAPGALPQLPDAHDPMQSELGDIAISYDTCAAEAQAAAKPFSAHVTHLLVHGTLHLLGFDHISEEDAALMERLEVEILAQIGLPDPYGTPVL